VVKGAQQGWSMPRRSLLLILLPLGVFAISGFLSWQFGKPAGYFPQPSVPNGAAEAAGRVKTIAAFLLFAGMAVGVLVYAAWTLRLLGRGSRIRVLVAYFLTVAAGLAVVRATEQFDGSPYLDQAFACSSFSQLNAPVADLALRDSGQRNWMTPQANTSPFAQRSPARPLRPNDLVALRRLVPPPGPACPASQFNILHLFMQIAGTLLLFAMPAVIFGAVICLAVPDTGSTKERLKTWTLQAARLNGFLYLAAAYMVSGLLFTSTHLNWVAYSIHPDDVGPLRAYISGIVLHGGISNSLVIASYYLPVAAWLAAARPAESAPATPAGQAAEAGAQPASPDPFAPLKIAATILAPALIGLAGDLLGLGG
jgi:hypothetical protein